MPIQLGLANLLRNKTRTALSVIGVGFAIVMVFLQLGFLGAVKHTAIVIYEKLNFDLIVRSPDYLHLCDTRHIDERCLTEVASLPGVQEVTPFRVGLAFWQHPESGENRGIILMGVDPSKGTFDVPELSQKAQGLVSPEFLLIDRKTRRDYGPRNGRVFSDDDIGVETDICEKCIQIVDHFELGTGLAANGAAVVNPEGFDRILPAPFHNAISFGLVNLKPGTNATEFKAKLDRWLKQNGSPSIEVLTRSEVISREIRRWVGDTPIGAIFQMGVAVALVVGAVIVYMVLSTDVTNHLPEYATLSAMGYRHRYLSYTVIQQAICLAILAFIPAWFFSETLYRITSSLANVPIMMSTWRPAFVFSLSIIMCLISAVGALRKLRQAAPADLF